MQEIFKLPWKHGRQRRRVSELSSRDFLSPGKGVKNRYGQPGSAFRNGTLDRDQMHRRKGRDGKPGTATYGRSGRSSVLKKDVSGNSQQSKVCSVNCRLNSACTPMTVTSDDAPAISTSPDTSGRVRSDSLTPIFRTGF